MNILQKIVSLSLLAVLCAGLLALPAAASSTYVEHEGLQVTVEMDKEQYDDGEPITATITVTNTNSEIVTIANLEQLIPDGYKLAEDSQVALKNVELSPNRTLMLKVTFVGEAAEAGEAASEDFFGNLLTGQTWGLPNLLLIVIAVIAFVIFMMLT